MRRLLLVLFFAPLLLAGTPVEDHGALQVVGNRIVGKAGDTVQLAGMSLSWPLWGGEKFHNKDVVDWLVSAWRCDLLRVPVGVEPKGGYLDHPEHAKAMLKEVVDDYALKKGLALFISEWGTSSADGGGGDDRRVYGEAAQVWMNWVDDHRLCWANWSVTDKNEASAALVPGASLRGGWPKSALSRSGRWVMARIFRRNVMKSEAVPLKD